MLEPVEKGRVRVQESALVGDLAGDRGQGHVSFFLLRDLEADWQQLLGHDDLLVMDWHLLRDEAGKLRE